LVVWSPRDPNGFEGTSSSFYEEVSPVRIPFPSDRIELSTSATQAIAPIVWIVSATSAFAGRPLPAMIGTLSVGPAELAAGAPVRRVLIPSTPPAFATTGAGVFASGSGYWVTVSSPPFLNFFDSGPTSSLILPSGMTFGYGFELATARVPSMTGMVDNLAVTWPDPLENGARINVRVGWLEAGSRIAKVGPRLPFHRVDTPNPGAVRLGTDLYVFANVIGTPLDMGPLDAGVPADSGMVADAGADGSAIDDVPLMPTISDFAFFRIPWGAGSETHVTQVGVVEPRVGKAQVVASSAAAFPNSDTTVGLSWVDLYLPDTAGHGVRYALYARNVTLR
jgi:hypothetical protein